MEIDIRVLGFFFFLFGLHYPPHFDSGKSKKKKKKNSSVSKIWHNDVKISYNLLCMDKICKKVGFYDKI